jgi:ribonucleoside-diphosphate reductase alpha chain
MASLRFMPNSPTLMNAGREMGMLSACFVLPVPDSVDGIFDSIKHTALIQKAGGGTGFAFDELRPTGDYIRSSGGTTSGPISFWRAFSEATNAIQQGAFRRGANMGMMYIDHPDILKFLHAKEDLTQFTNYNISIKVTDGWMESFLAEPDAPHVVRNPRTGCRYLLPKSLKIWEYDLRSLPPADGVPVAAGEFYTRRDIWKIIVTNAWRTGEPGVVFIDRINEANPTPHVGRIEATNPCGEQPLLPFEACNLGSVNLAKFVTNPCTPQAEVDWEDLRCTVHDATRFLDDVIDVNRYPLPQIDRICNRNRKIGLGIMGFADALFMLGVGYNTDEGVEWGERIMRFVNDESHACSERLADERGCFPNWPDSIWDTVHHRPMRNATCTTVAPTGTISIIAGCSCGIEPLYSLAFYRNVLRGQDQGQKPMIEVNSIFERAAQTRGLFSEELMDRLAREGTLAGMEEVGDDLRRVFVCAHDVSPEWHVKMQAAFQKCCDASISKTINFAQSATVHDVERLYLDSYRLGCKGVTVYRNNCRAQQPMALKGDKTQTRHPTVETQQPPPRGGHHVPEPRDLKDITGAVRIRQITPFGNMHVQITVDVPNDQELEVFAQLGKGGDLANSDLEAICRLTSLWLRSGGRLHHVISQLRGIGSSLQVATKEGKVRSLGDGLSRALGKYARAKAKFGLKNLIIGQFDPGELGNDWAEMMKHETGAFEGASGGDGGNGNGHKNGGGNGRGSVSEGRVAGTGRDHHPGLMEREELFKVICPECRTPLRFAEGCVKCEFCGFSQC